MNELRAERVWHAGHTLIIFRTVGPNQVAIDVCGSEITDEAPRDHVTRRKIQHSLCLGEDDIIALEDFLRKRREQR
jgi:hypothetical protein